MFWSRLSYPRFYSSHLHFTSIDVASYDTCELDRLCCYLISEPWVSISGEVKISWRRLKVIETGPL